MALGVSIFSRSTVTGQSTMTINGKSIVNGTLQIACGNDEW